MVIQMQENPSLREQVVSFVEKYRGMAYAQTKLEEWVSKAIESIGVLPQSEDKDWLVWFAHYTGGRSL